MSIDRNFAEADAPKHETPHTRFLRHATDRTEQALQRLRQLGNCSGAGYEYTEEEAQQIMDALFDAVHDVKRKFSKRKQGHQGFAFQNTVDRE